MAKKKKRKPVKSPQADAPPAPARDEPVPGPVKASVALGVLGLLATLVWPAALVLDGLAIFLGGRALGAKALSDRARARARLGMTLGIMGLAVVAALGGLVLVGKSLPGLSKEDQKHRIFTPRSVPGGAGVKQEQRSR